jgi:hypothetical protein
MLGARKGCKGQQQQNFITANISPRVKSLKLENIHPRKSVFATYFLLG